MFNPLLSIARQLVCLALLLGALTGNVKADVFVSPSGNDANPGTMAAPLRTPARAQALARKQGAGGNHIFLRGGRYPLASPLALTGADSGEVWQAYGHEVPVLSGGSVLTGWKQHDPVKNIWQASAPAGADFRELWVNGVRYVRAYSTAISALLPSPTLTSTGYATAGSPLAGYGDPGAIELVWYLQWEDRRCPLASADASNVTFAPAPFAILQNSDALHVSPSSLPYAIENAYEFLSAATPGEFYLNRRTHLVYVVPRPADDLRKANVIAPVLQTPITVTGASGVTFFGLTFSHSAWTYPNAHGFPEIQTDTYAATSHWPAVKGDVPRLPACVAVSGGFGTVFRRCTFTHIAADGLSLDDGIRSPLVVGCIFSDIGGTGLAVSRPSDYRTADLPRDVMIRDSIFTACGAQYKGCTAISAPYTDHLTVRNNYLHDLPYTAIHIGWGWGDRSVASNGNRATLIARNLIVRPMQLMMDGGGIYDNGYTASATITGNVVTGLTAFAYYLDDGSINKLVIGNIAYDDLDHPYQCNNNVGGNTVIHNFFDETGAYRDGAGGLRGTPYNTYGPNQAGLTVRTLPASILGNAGLEPAYGGRAPVNSHSPGAPQGLHLSGTGASLIVSVTPPKSTGQGGVTGYEVWDGDTLLFVMTSPSATYSFLSTGKMHRIAVRARDAEGNLSPPSLQAIFSN